MRIYTDSRQLPERRIILGSSGVSGCPGGPFAAIDEGVNFLDNAWCYHDGESERIVGEALRGGYRDRVFLMTKNHGRDGKTFKQQLDESLRRLETDHADLLQFHNILAEDDPERTFSEGAIEAVLEAKRLGKIRFIGFSGHRWPHLFRRMLEKDFPWDTVQHPVNRLNAQYRSFTREALPILNERAMPWAGSDGLEDYKQE